LVLTPETTVDGEATNPLRVGATGGDTITVVCRVPVPAELTQVNVNVVLLASVRVVEDALVTVPTPWSMEQVGAGVGWGFE
jgi:hypothetical protein